MGESTLKLTERGYKVADTWATGEITKLRIQRTSSANMESLYFDVAPDGSLTPTPWALDGVDMRTLELSEEIEFYSSHANAVAAIPQFLATHGLTVVPHG